MCLGIPMQVIEVHPYSAVCRNRDNSTVIVDTRLVGNVAVQDWLMTFAGAARQRLNTEEAMKCLDALRALDGLMTGGKPDLDDAFADLVGQEPELPAFLQPEVLARSILSDFARSMELWLAAPEGPAPIRDLDGIDSDTREVLNDLLGQGEVSVRIEGAPLRLSQETKFPGIWRTVTVDPNGSCVPHENKDILEAGPMPAFVRASLESQTSSSPEIELRDVPGSVAALLNEVVNAQADYAPSRLAHQIILSHMPFKQEDMSALSQSLGSGPVSIRSLGFGPCVIASTGLRHVWWLRYLTESGATRMETLEVVDIPDAARATIEDITRSHADLRELVSQL